MSGSDSGLTIGVGTTLVITTPYSVPTNLTFSQNMSNSMVSEIDFTAQGLTVTTVMLNGTLTPIASFGGGTIQNFEPENLNGNPIENSMLPDVIEIQNIGALIGSLSTSSASLSAAAVLGLGDEPNGLIFSDGLLYDPAHPKYPLQGPEDKIFGDLLYGLFGPAAYQSNLVLSFSKVLDPNDDKYDIVNLTIVPESPVNPCFAEGTFILTPQGEVKVETLKIGDKVITPEGEETEIVWIGQRTLNLTTLHRPDAVRPVIIEPGALAPNVPNRRLRLSPDHALYIDGLLVPAKALINWTSIRQDQQATQVSYYHLELPRHGVLFANGTPVESFLDTGHRGVFDNVDSRVIALPAAMQARREAESFAPLCTQGPELEALRTRIALLQTAPQQRATSA